MSMTLAEMRSIVNNTNINETTNDYEIITEAALKDLCDSILDEAYYGRKAVQPIIDAMTDCCKVLDDNPTENMMKTTENKELEKAIQKVFGFKRVSIIWENRGVIVKGAYTIPGSPTKYGTKPGFKFGTHKDGFYDETHSLPVFIELSNDMYRECQLTPEEMTAILIHEIGHNFDFTPYTMIIGWTMAILAIIKLIIGLGDGTWPNTLYRMFLKTDAGRGYAQFMLNIDNLIMNYVPPLGMIGRGINKVVKYINKFINVLLSPLTLFSIPVALINAPMVYVVSFFSRKKEIYADAFAAGYGLGPELSSGLVKFDAYASRMSIAPAGSLAELFYDFSMFSREFMCTFCDKSGHGSAQQRMIKTRAKLEKDLKNNDFDPALKKELIDMISDMDEVYDDFLTCDEYEKKTITAFFRSLIDKAYGGKDYMFIPPTPNEFPE